MNVHRVLRGAESLRAVDRPAASVATTVRRVLRRTRTDGVLRGSWLGHPLHPLLVVVPLGAWVCSTAFDYGVGTPETARKLIAFGLATTPPAMLLGLADYAELDERQRRVGLVHAPANTAAVALFTASYLARGHSARSTAGKIISLLALTAVSAGGALGGHLTYAQGAGVHRWQTPANE
ncbi:Uncharacterized membrane protein [Amycolatopsis marina]|uniref:Uncharacterized membrane protein n=1 Tax=Amycolatopsis marina TaxID=490629 RepID=A0A1I0VLY3_9PSEU|nr:DUF2231 domain-containing protein [Amycolatopsis marina]SFA76596.1 Uncharacterized membrane protein [Amycolatopsis marina]